MSGITTGVGLVSGINTKSLIDQLISLDSRPKMLLQKQVTVLTSQNTALAEVSAKVLALKSSVSSLTSTTLYNGTSANSSNTNVLTATSSASASPGTYNFHVARLVSTQQSLSTGFVDSSTTAVGAGTLTFESGAARLDRDTPLTALHGGAGITRGKIRITDRSGASAVVDLSRVASVNDVLEAINSASGVNVQASVTGDRLKLTDSSGGAGALAVANVGTTNTAASLGLTTDSDGDASTITGAVINYVTATTAIAALNDGNSIEYTGGTDLTFNDGVRSFSVAFSNIKTLGDMINAINNATGNDNGAGGKLATASINDDRTGLKIAYSNGGTLVVAGNSATELGIATTGSAGDVTGARLIAGINSKLIRNLNGGDGAALGTFSLTARDGTAINNIDLSSATSIDQVISLINNAAGNGGKIVAGLSNSGTGLTLTDTTGGAGNLAVTGTGAEDLGFADATSVAASTLSSGNLQLRYVSEGAKLDTLNGGAGITRGKFKITDSRGIVATVDATGSVTIGDLIRNINSRGLQVSARINDNGDGILIEDTGPGTTAIKVEEDGSTTAKSLGILGTAASAGADINGSFEKTVTVEATDKLQDVASKINAAGYNAKAAILNDGSPVNPYRLSLTASKSGSAGAFVFDDGGLGFNVSTLNQGRDAVVFYGSSNAASALPITSTTNTLSNLITGVTVDLKNTSESPVELTVSRDDSAIVTAVKSMVDAFNGVFTSINKHDSYNSETKQRGLLLGDSTLALVRSSLFGVVNRRSSEVSSQYTSFAQIGITVGSGAKLNFDETDFREALTNDRDAIINLFTFKTTSTNAVTNETTITKAGLGVRFDEVLKKLTDSTTGSLQVRTDAINKEIELDNKRIAQMDTLLAAKKARYQAQFNAMEKALAGIQNQSGAMTNLANIAANAASGGG